MNNALETIREISQSILPLIGVIVLILTIVLVIKLIRILKNLNSVLLKTNSTVDLVDKSIEKVQAPLDSAVKLSHSVDVAHDATIKGLEEAKEFIVKGTDIIKDRISNYSANNSNSGSNYSIDEIKEPSPDDIIGG